ncbi:bifunctional nuclease family protein [Salinirubrum litoreum]|uniref:Bifunctional nuclease family protein n=1 Tax=Salinirubrum litoreum TaxID=1126234 RepID=A0ABD5RCX5_9EURY|nr:bifunctional nuclease domain-containing protein [Salinirubrum litoreum]
MHATIDAVRVAGTPDGPTPVVLLAVDGGGSAVLPIFVGFEEAIAIVRGIDDPPGERPGTHDLLLDAVEELGGRVERVVVSDLDDSTYIADLHVATPRGSTVLDARPSDALALAARTGSPVEVTETVFAEGSERRTEFDGLSELREVLG